jgi:16S rRNA (guanine966-N2)-methyltransferase
MSNPRIISGKARGIRLFSVPGDSTRPITDRTKEALFNIIGNDVIGSSWLDLFAGTGSVGIEALSRGAVFARFLDIQRNAIETIQKNLKLTRFMSHAETIRMDAFAYLERLPDRSFDYIYIAPPQYKEMWKRTLTELTIKPGWLSTDGWIIVQIHPIEYQPLNLYNIVEFDLRQYGSTRLVFYRKAN